MKAITASGDVEDCYVEFSSQRGEFITYQSIDWRQDRILITDKDADTAIELLASRCAKAKLK